MFLVRVLQRYLQYWSNRVKFEKITASFSTKNKQDMNNDNTTNEYLLYNAQIIHSVIKLCFISSP